MLRQSIPVYQHATWEVPPMTKPGYRTSESIRWVRSYFYTYYKMFSALKSLMIEDAFTQTERNNGWNINFLENSPLVYLHIYFIGFFICWRIYKSSNNTLEMNINNEIEIARHYFLYEECCIRKSLYCLFFGGVFFQVSTGPSHLCPMFITLYKSVCSFWFFK